MNKGHHPVILPRSDHLEMIHSIENALLPDQMAGSEMLFETKARTSAAIRRCFNRLGIKHVRVSCPDEETYILIQLPWRTFDDRYQREIAEEWAKQPALYKKLDKIIRIAYPFISWEIQYGTEEEWKEQKKQERRWRRVYLPYA